MDGLTAIEGLNQVKVASAGADQQADVQPHRVEIHVMSGGVASGCGAGAVGGLPKLVTSP